LVFPYTEMKKTDSTLLLESEKLNRDQVTPQVTPQIEKLLIMLPSEMTREELQDLMQLKDRKSFSEVYLKPALEAGLIEMTIPDRPNSRLQKYRLTEKGKVAISEG